MNPLFLIKGFFLGLGLAIPIGPVGILCLRYSLTKGRTAGFSAGLGAATADMLYAILAAFGMAFIMNPLLQHQVAFHCLGGIFLCFIGTHLFFSGATKPDKPKRTNKPFFNYVTTFLLTMSNPTTLLMFVALFTVLGIEESGQTTFGAASLVSMVFIGSCLGWFAITSVAHFYRARIDGQVLQKINSFASSAIVLFGVYTISKALLK